VTHCTHYVYYTLPMLCRNNYAYDSLVIGYTHEFSVLSSTVTL